MIARRRLLLALGAAPLCAALPASGQQPAGPVRLVGLLYSSARPVEIALTRLRELGWEEGRNLRVERGSGSEALLPALAEELVRKRVEVIWTFGPEAALAAARATTNVPIVFAAASNPVESGLVKSLARPGQNVTGIAFTEGAQIGPKHLDLIKELVPAARRVAMITVPASTQTVAGGAYSIEAMEAAARKLGMELKAFPVGRTEDFDAAFTDIAAWRPHALRVVNAPLLAREQKRIVAFASRSRLPALYGATNWVVETGGLASYGPDIAAVIGQSLRLLDRVLRGAKPAELPVELPTRYELVLNLKTAKALGLRVPEALRVRADRVIE